ncbi:hypothetical protein Tco_0814958 [Tanacetum coccineum]
MQPEFVKLIVRKIPVHSAYFSPTRSFVATTSVDDKIEVLSGTNYDEELSDQKPAGSSIDLVYMSKKSTLKLIFHPADPFLLNNLLKFTDLILHRYKSKVSNVFTKALPDVAWATHF